MATAGNGELALGSVKLNFNLGRAAFGNYSGRLRVDAADVTSDLYSPKSLFVDTLSADKAAIVSAQDGSLRQVGAFECLADIQVVTTGQVYQVAFYETNGLNAINNSGQMSVAGLTPLVTWTIGNPDLNASNRLQVIETRAGHSITNLITSDSANQRWKLLSGNGLRKEVLQKSWNSDQTYLTEVRQIMDPARQQVLSQTVFWKRLLPFVLREQAVR